MSTLAVPCKPKSTLLGITTRQGIWRCARHPILTLSNSLAIAHHVGRFAVSLENTPEIRHIPKGQGCGPGDVYFQCDDHGEEEA